MAAIRLTDVYVVIGINDDGFRVGIVPAPKRLKKIPGVVVYSDRLTVEHRRVQVAGRIKSHAGGKIVVGHGRGQRPDQCAVPTPPLHL
jgi:hypothetical protein